MRSYSAARAHETKTRIEAIDLCRGLSVIGMVLVHTHDLYGNEAIHDLDSWVGMFMAGLSLMAPMFLFAMGVSFGLSSKITLRVATRVGARRIAQGYLLNAVQFLVPMMLGIVPASFIAINEWPTPPLSASQMLHIVAVGDVLQLAGLTIVLMGVAGRLSSSPRVVFAWAVAIAGLSAVVQGYRPGIAVLDGVCDLLWGDQWNVYFPVVPWASSPFLGMAFGLHIRQSDMDPAPAFRQMLRVGATLSTIGALLWWSDPEFHFRDFFHMGPGVALLLMGVTSLLFWLGSHVVRHLEGSWLSRLAFYCSRRVTAVYATHLVLLTWGMAVVGFKAHGLAVVAVLSIVCLAATLGIDAGLRRVLDKVRVRRSGAVGRIDPAMS